MQRSSDNRGRCCYIFKSMYVYKAASKNNGREQCCPTLSQLGNKSKSRECLNAVCTGAGTMTFLLQLNKPVNTSIIHYQNRHKVGVPTFFTKETAVAEFWTAAMLEELADLVLGRRACFHCVTESMNLAGNAADWCRRPC